MTKAPKTVLTSYEVLATLREKLWHGEAFTWLEEVRNGTGWQRETRSADALVVSCWPSRGIYAMGVEVKVSRSDWVRELKDPKKSAEVQQYCKYWWIAAAEGVVKEEEIPPTWGWVEVLSSKRHEVRKQAPELEAKEPSWTFVASVLRNMARKLEAAKGEGREEGRAKAELADAERQQKADDALHQLKELESVKAQLTRLGEKVREFQDSTGLSIDGYRAGERAAATLRLAKRLECLDIPHFCSSLDQMAFGATNIAKLTREELIVKKES
jgi:hypothetical protein